MTDFMSNVHIESVSATPAALTLNHYVITCDHRRGNKQHPFVTYIVSGFKLLNSSRERMFAVSYQKRVSSQEFLTNVESAWLMDYFSGVKIISRSVDGS